MSKQLGKEVQSAIEREVQREVDKRTKFVKTRVTIEEITADGQTRKTRGIWEGDRVSVGYNSHVPSYQPAGSMQPIYVQETLDISLSPVRPLKEWV